MKKLLFLIALVFTSNSFAQINFEKGSLTDVMSKAKEQNKVLMVDVMTDWCVWCVELDNLVYTRQDISEYANANQINYKIDAEKGEGIAFKEKYKVEGYPTILFLDGEGNEVDRIFGYYPAPQFKELMMDYSQKKNTTLDLKARLEKDANDIEANYKYADKLMTQNKKDEAITYYKNVITLDPDNKFGRTDDVRFMMADMSDKDAIQNLQTFIKDYPTSDVIKDAYMSLGDKYNTAADIVSAEKTYKEALGLFPNDEQVKISYGRFLNSQARTIGKNEMATAEDFKKGLDILETAIPYMPGSTGEAAAHYWQSVFYFNLKDYTKALEAIDKSLKIFNAKPYREQKEKIEKQLTSK